MLKEVILLCSPEMNCCIHVKGLQHRKDIDLFEQVQRSATELVRAVEHASYKDRLRQLG